MNTLNTLLELGFTKSVLEKKIGFSDGYISNIYKNERKLCKKSIKKIETFHKHLTNSLLESYNIILKTEV
jgi:hypothetical protein